ncbi:LysR family transcriptional regulator [Acidomonas methanolica]|uniref:Transcriptional regulator LysR n=1 Tax=Acidomonas methanolica NBRC 104435 TaxID=1231351 RepID=A0A023D8E4_ACIMT|nr:LysR family transcriptional regulator [Acidomonas methanolica]TCS16492.1 LysR family transcriptional regulator [Acidomonas methanolica]GAJ30364.1 transcriptional regulator LysR [Acidomonas methanolica NBRC 104435]GBQ53817.1 transcriptional regulator [Acidomonas methanolica]GEL00776.1 LysR family transcriptional regulator [Acidomonas methanolica NBRC 104435]
MIPTYDLNLLTSLDMLLAESSVNRAAERLGLSNSAMSRTLSRIRETFGDPILVRAGRSLVPTPRALELRETVRQVLESAEALRMAPQKPDFKQIDRVFDVRANEGFVFQYGGKLIKAVSREAPGIRLSFVIKAEKKPNALRDGQIDLDIGVLGESGPEIRTQTIQRDRFVGVVRADHRLSSHETISAKDYAEAHHVSVSRRGLFSGPIDKALEIIGLRRQVSAVVTSFPSALSVARTTDLIASVPERQTAEARRDMYTFPLPVETEEVRVSMMWHPRSEHDPVHRWLREHVRQLCST